MAWLVGLLVYLTLHLTLYLAFLRNRDTFRRERGIFAYHVLSAAVSVSAVTGVVFFAPAEALAVLAVVVSLHGIYSMSFLELWSLSQGSYSITILRSLDQAGAETSLDEAALEAVGADKRENRLKGLESMGLTWQDGDRAEL